MSRKNIGESPMEFSGWDEDIRNDAKNISWSGLHHIIMDYFINDMREIARLFAEESAVFGNFVINPNDDLFVIMELIQRGQITDAIHKIIDLDPELFDRDRSLYFTLQMQVVIEMIRTKEFVKAVNFAKENLAEMVKDNSEWREEMEKCMTLMIYQHPEQSQLKEYMEIWRRSQLAQQVQTCLQYRPQQAKLEFMARMFDWQHDLLAKEGIGLRFDKNT